MGLHETTREFESAFPHKVTNFFTSNKHLRPTFEPVKNKDGHWIYQHSRVPWLLLDIDMPYEDIYEEAAGFVEDMIPQAYPQLFDPDRDDVSKYEDPNDDTPGQVGWNTICVHGLEKHNFDRGTIYGYSHEDDVPYKWTEIADRCPVAKEFLESLPYEKLYRARFTMLAPGGYAAPHIGRKQGADYNQKVNFALNHPEGFHFALDDAGDIPWKAGRGFLINADEYYHTVFNHSDVIRIHLITMGKPDWEKMGPLIEKAYYGDNPFGYDSE